jgi:hypothetical protein
VTSGKLRCFLDPANGGACRYNPTGYVLSAEKDKEDEKLKVRTAMQSDRLRRQAQDAAQRLAADVPVTRAG